MLGMCLKATSKHGWFPGSYMIIIITITIWTVLPLVHNPNRRDAQCKSKPLNMPLDAQPLQVRHPFASFEVRLASA